MRWGPPHLSQCRSSGTKINSWNGVWIGHGCRMMVVLLFDYHPIDHLQPEPLAFYRAVVFYRREVFRSGDRIFFLTGTLYGRPRPIFGKVAFRSRRTWATALRTALFSSAR